MTKVAAATQEYCFDDTVAYTHDEDENQVVQEEKQTSVCWDLCGPHLPWSPPQKQASVSLSPAGPEYLQGLVQKVDRGGSIDSNDAAYMRHHDIYGLYVDNIFTTFGCATMRIRQILGLGLFPKVTPALRLVGGSQQPAPPNTTNPLVAGTTMPAPKPKFQKGFLQKQGGGKKPKTPAAKASAALQVAKKAESTAKKVEKKEKFDWTQPEAVCAFARLYPDKAPAVLFPWSQSAGTSVGVPRKTTVKYPLQWVQLRDSTGANVPNQFCAAAYVLPYLKTGMQQVSSTALGPSAGIGTYTPASLQSYNIVDNTALATFCDVYQINAICARIINNTPGMTAGASCMMLQRSDATIRAMNLDTAGLDPAAREMPFGTNGDVCAAWKSQTPGDFSTLTPASTFGTTSTNLAFFFVSTVAQNVMIELTYLWQYRALQTNSAFITPVMTKATSAGIQQAVVSVPQSSDINGTLQNPQQRESTGTKIAKGLGLAAKNFMSGNWGGLIDQGIDLISSLFRSKKIAHRVRSLVHDPDLEKEVLEALAEGEIPEELAKLWLALNNFHSRLDLVDGKPVFHLRLPDKSLWTRKVQRVDDDPFGDSATETVTLKTGGPLLPRLKPARDVGQLEQKHAPEKGEEDNESNCSYELAPAVNMAPDAVFTASVVNCVGGLTTRLT